MLHLLLFLMLVGCQSIPSPPPFAYGTPEGITYAHTPAEAEFFGRKADSISRDVRDLLRIQDAEPFELRILDHEVPGSAQAGVIRWYNIDGFTTRYIRFGTERRDAWPWILAHELTHWHVEEAWNLPLVLEEGLAELVAASIVTGGEQILEQHHATYEESRDDPLLQGDLPLRVTRATWRDFTAEQRRMLYAYGYVHAKEMGVDQLRNFQAPFKRTQDTEP